VDKLKGRLAPITQKLADAVGHYRTLKGDGTASLVYRSPDGTRGLVLTNYHVAPKLPDSAGVYFGDVSGKVTGWLTGEAHLDYALLEVSFATPVPKSLVPLSLTTQKPSYGGVYTIGFPNVAHLYLKKGPFVHFDHTAHDAELDAAPEGVKYINLGLVRAGGRIQKHADSDPDPEHREVVPRLSFTTDLQTLPGASGSPVFSSKKHKMIGLVWVAARVTRAPTPTSKISPGRSKKAASRSRRRASSRICVARKRTGSSLSTVRRSTIC
jgi:hypothetical protein